MPHEVTLNLVELLQILHTHLARGLDVVSIANLSAPCEMVKKGAGKGGQLVIDFPENTKDYPRVMWFRGDMLQDFRMSSGRK